MPFFLDSTGFVGSIAIVFDMTKLLVFLRSSRRFFCVSSDAMSIDEKLKSASEFDWLRCSLRGTSSIDSLASPSR